MAIAGLVPVVFPFHRLGLVTEADQDRVWLLAVFCAGILAILFGVAAWLGGPRMLTVRDVVEEGGVVQAVEKRRRANRDRAEVRRYGNAATWTILLGGFLVGIYFVLWLLQGAG